MLGLFGFGLYKTLSCYKINEWILDSFLVDIRSPEQDQIVNGISLGKIHLNDNNKTKKPKLKIDGPSHVLP